MGEVASLKIQDFFAGAAAGATEGAAGVAGAVELAAGLAGEADATAVAGTKAPGSAQAGVAGGVVVVLPEDLAVLK